MRFVGFVVCVFAVATGGCATHPAPPVNAPPMAASQTASQPAGQTAGSQISGVWDALSRTTIGEGIGAGDTRIEKQEWHLSQAGSAISGYYIAALTFVSGDGRPYVCNRQPQFSATQRFDVAGRGARRADRDRGEGTAGHRERKPLRPRAETPGALQRSARRRRADAGERRAAPDALPDPSSRTDADQTADHTREPSAEPATEAGSPLADASDPAIRTRRCHRIRASRITRPPPPRP